MIEFDLVTIDTPDTDRSGAFWRAALGLVEMEREDEGRWVVLGTRDGVRRLGLQRGRHLPGGVHLDLVCALEEVQAEVERLVGLGANQLSAVRTEPYGTIVNLADPDGNLFDLCAYT